MSLTESIAAIQEMAKERIPEEDRKLMARATEELRKSGQVEKALQQGDMLPPFLLESVGGEKLSSDDLLGQGPLVVSFYRGNW
ncbi:MAG: hypothetical protein QNJ17_08725 [Desulfocapsaceae bacterium]|nr:hypothetical protein [Desulfocapsaceae bacterium]